MKILEANAGALANLEVLDFLRAKGASKDPTRVIAKVAEFEYKVYDYLVNTAACDRSRENINEFLERVKLHDLAKAEVLNILNIRPAAPVEIYPIIQNLEARFPDEKVAEIVEVVKQTLPLPPSKMTPEEITQGTPPGQKEELQARKVLNSDNEHHQQISKKLEEIQALNDLQQKNFNDEIEKVIRCVD